MPESRLVRWHRPTFFRHTGLAGSALAVCSQTAADGCPNVLLVMTDERTAEAMNRNGISHANTSAVDWDPADGLRFSCGCPAEPLCLPCRSRVQAGLIPQAVGTSINAAKFNNTHPTLAHPIGADSYQRTALRTS